MMNPTHSRLGEPTAALLTSLLPPFPATPDLRMEFTGSMNVCSSKVEPRYDPDSGRGLFALSPLMPGELIAIWGGRITSLIEFGNLPDPLRKLSLQVEDDFFLVPQGGANAADYINHSCAPNAGMAGQILVVAMRLITPGEEICYDYAMSDGSSYDEFECCCGALECRGKVTGRDWERPELWSRYEGYFSPYLARRISGMSGLLQMTAS